MPLSLFTEYFLRFWLKLGRRGLCESLYLYTAHIKWASPEVYELAYLYPEVLKSAPCIWSIKNAVMVRQPQWWITNGLICTTDRTITQIQSLVKSCCTGDILLKIPQSVFQGAMVKIPMIKLGASGKTFCNLETVCSTVSFTLASFALGWMYTTVTNIWGDSRGK